MEKDYIQIIEDGYCEEDGKQSDLSFWFSYYDKEKKCFVFNDAHCFVCDNELELEIGEENLNNYFDEEEIKILLEKKKEMEMEEIEEALKNLKLNKTNVFETVVQNIPNKKIKKIIIIWEGDKNND